MAVPKFIQIHTLTSYPASLLNRDDVGFAKRVPFGGITRTRVSSQCLKRHWRTHDGEHALSKIDEYPGESVRSRLTFELRIRKPLMDAHGVKEEVADAVTTALMDEVLGKSAKAKESKKKGEEDKSKRFATGQITVLGRPELEYLLAEAVAIAAKLKPGKDLAKSAAKAVKERLKDRSRKDNLKALKCAAGLEAAMFGRMVTSDLLARTDAAVHVAHAFTVHPESTESDYFSAIDDLLREQEDTLGSGHIGNIELTAGLYYSYVVVDLPLLISNLTGCPREQWVEHRSELAAEVLRRLVHLIATVSPGAKLGSTAPHSYAQWMMVERGNAQPRTLANAFLKPVRNGQNVLEDTYTRIREHLTGLDQMYASGEERRFAGMGPVGLLAPALDPETQRSPLPGVAKWAADTLKGA